MRVVCAFWHVVGNGRSESFHKSYSNALRHRLCGLRKGLKGGTTVLLHCTSSHDALARNCWFTLAGIMCSHKPDIHPHKHIASVLLPVPACTKLPGHHQLDWWQR